MKCKIKNKKLVYKKIQFFVVAIIAIGMTSCSNIDNSKKFEQKTFQNNENNVIIKNESENNIPAKYKNVLEDAIFFSNTLEMSKAKVYDALVQGKKFTAEEIQYAMDNIEVDWKENAIKVVKSYGGTKQYAMDYLSKVEMYEYLISESQMFTIEEAQYAVDNAGIDWETNALGKVRLENNDLLASESKIETYNHLILDGFTIEEAQYAVDNAGVDWKTNALHAAEHHNMLHKFSLSKAEIYNYLTFNCKFTTEEAQYAIEEL